MLLIDSLDIEGDGTEAVVAANHGAHRVFHPTAIEIALTIGEGDDEGLHRLPRGGAETIGALTVDRDPYLLWQDVAGMFNLVLVLLDEVEIDTAADYSYANIFHIIFRFYVT